MSMIVKKNLSQLEKLRNILGEQRGILRTSDLAKNNIPRTYLSILQEKGEIERVSRGIYKSIDSIEDEFFSFQARYKTSVYSHETALYLHDLADRTPLSYTVTVPIGYHSTSLKESPHKIFYLNRALFDIGLTIMTSPHGNEIKATGLERTIIDLLRSRKKMDIQLVNKALNEYIKRKERNINLLYAYAEKFRIQKILRQYIEILL